MYLELFDVILDLCDWVSIDVVPNFNLLFSYYFCPDNCKDTKTTHVYTHTVVEGNIEHYCHVKSEVDLGLSVAHLSPAQAWHAGVGHNTLLWLGSVGFACARCWEDRGTWVFHQLQSERGMCAACSQAPGPTQEEVSQQSLKSWIRTLPSYPGLTAGLSLSVWIERCWHANIPLFLL